ncbi:MAG: imidazolonepropionase [Flavobacteriaceae bacterium]
MITQILHIKELLQVRDSNIKKVSGSDMKVLPSIKNAFLILEDDCILDYGSMDTMPNINADKTIDATGKIILPSWCDSHTHLIFAGNRENEFVDRINGLTYEEIAQKGGGILNSAKKLQETSFGDLYQQSAKRIEEIIALGTGSVEIKSGYGLNLKAEMKMLKVAKKLATNYPIEIKTTFLGAHAFPLEFKSNKEAYVEKVCEEMLPQIAKENLADFIDVFCETGYFSPQQTERIIIAGKKHGLQAKIHSNQFTSIGGIQVSTKHQALSVDHLEILTDDDLASLKNTNTMPVALPGCSFFLSIPYTPARKIIDNGLALALASDYNPGSTPSGNMNLVIAMACVKMKMTPEEAINAATINGAYAMNLSNTHGSITIGKKANLIITKKINSYAKIPYAFGSHLIDSVILNGKEVSF